METPLAVPNPAIARAVGIPVAVVLAAAVGVLLGSLFGWTGVAADGPVDAVVRDDSWRRGEVSMVDLYYSIGVVGMYLVGVVGVIAAVLLLVGRLPGTVWAVLLSVTLVAGGALVVRGAQVGLHRSPPERDRWWQTATVHEIAPDLVWVWRVTAIALVIVLLAGVIVAVLPDGILTDRIRRTVLLPVLVVAVVATGVVAVVHSFGTETATDVTGPVALEPATADHALSFIA